MLKELQSKLVPDQPDARKMNVGFPLPDAIGPMGTRAWVWSGSRPRVFPEGKLHVWIWTGLSPASGPDGKYGSFPHARVVPFVLKSCSRSFNISVSFAIFHEQNHQIISEEG
jgi:hypothetical protein